MRPKDLSRTADEFALVQRLEKSAYRSLGEIWRTSALCTTR